MTALALTLPQQHFARDTFSEIPAQLLVFAGLALLYDLVRRRKHLPAPLLAGAVAGAVFGTSCIVRIDAFFYLVPLTAVATVLWLAGARRLAAGLVVGTAVPAGIGYLDLRVGSTSYLGLQAANLRLIFVALALTAVVAVVVLLLHRRSLGIWERLRGRALGAGVAVLLIALSVYAGIVRPFVETGRHLSPQQPTAVASLQEAAGLPVDPLRSYDELSVQWISWYLGPVAVALGLLGFALLVRRVLLRTRSAHEVDVALAGLAFLLLFGASTALYLWRPSIVPVQYWATRRFLPVTIPGLLLCAVWLGSTVGRTGLGRTALHRTALRRAAAGAIAAALLLPPLIFLQGHAKERDYVPMLAITEQLCDALGPDDAVVLLGGTRLATGMPQTLRAFCGVPVAVSSAETTTGDLRTAAQAAAAAGRRLVYLSAVEQPALVDGPVPGDFRPVVDLTVSVVALELTGRPDERFAFPVRVWSSPAP